MYSLLKKSTKLCNLAIAACLAGAKVCETTIQEGKQAIQYFTEKEKAPAPLFKIGETEVYVRDVQVASSATIALCISLGVIYVVYQLITWITTPTPNYAIRV